MGKSGGLVWFDLGGVGMEKRKEGSGPVFRGMIIPRGGQVVSYSAPSNTLKDQREREREGLSKRERERGKTTVSMEPLRAS